MALDGERELLTLGRYAGEFEGICGGDQRGNEEKRERNHNKKDGK